MNRRLALWLVVSMPMAVAADPATIERCAVCHSDTGAEERGVPRLDGQKAEYLRRQLADFRSGARRSEEMTAIASQLTDQVIDELVRYFSGRAMRPRNVAGSPDPARPPLIFCVRCHGADGVSPNDLWPNLAGQPMTYLRRQMQSYRSGERDDPMMASWGAKLSPEETEDVLAYFERLGH